MPDVLAKVRFSEALLRSSLVQTFDCGEEYWEREMSNWIKAEPSDPAGALALMIAGRCEVWLHVNQARDLVGFSSLGESSWRWPLKKSPKVPISLIPGVAIQKRFWQQPPGDRKDRYSTQILDHLIGEAVAATKQNPGRQPYLGLYVHPKNEGAIKLYLRTGFEWFHQKNPNKEIGVSYASMILKLDVGSTQG